MWSSIIWMLGIPPFTANYSPSGIIIVGQTVSWLFVEVLSGAKTLIVGGK